MSIAMVTAVTGELPPIESALLGLVVSLLAHPVVLVLGILGAVAAFQWGPRLFRITFPASRRTTGVTGPARLGRFARQRDRGRNP